VNGYGFVTQWACPALALVETRAASVTCEGEFASTVGESCNAAFAWTDA